MAPKRSLPETATETSPKPKKRVSLASSDTKVVVKKGKRKVDTLDPVEDEIVPKAPRRVSTKTAARKAATVEVPAVEIETEIVIVAVEKKPRVIKKKIVATEPLSG